MMTNKRQEKVASQDGMWSPPPPDLNRSTLVEWIRQLCHWERSLWSYSCCSTKLPEGHKPVSQEVWWDQNGVIMQKCVYVTTRGPQSKESLRPQDPTAAGMFLVGLGKGGFYTMTQHHETDFKSVCALLFSWSFHLLKSQHVATNVHTQTVRPPRRLRVVTWSDISPSHTQTHTSRC